MQNFLDGIAIVESRPEKAHFVGPRSQSLIQLAAKRLNVAFPPTYLQFLLKLGAGSFGSAEFYGVIDDNFEVSCVPDGIWCTLSERKQIALPMSLVVVANTGYGDLYCVDTTIKPEGPVIIYQTALPAKDQQREIVCEDFGAFFLEQLKVRL